MQHISTTLLVTTVCLAVLLLAGGCSQEPDAVQGRLQAIEAELAVIKAAGEEREAQLRHELSMINKNLETMRALIELDMQRAEEGTASDDSVKDDAETLEGRTRTFVNENLDRLMDLTKKLIEKMEKEIDEARSPKEVEPEGDTI